MGFKDKPQSKTPADYTEQAGKVVLTDFKGRKKEYTTVAARLHEFWSDPKHEGWCITTGIVERSDDVVVFYCSIYDNSDRLRASGHAEELRGINDINTTSALENAETSSIGRALACLGIGGESFASADEVQSAKDQQIALEAIRAEILPVFEESAEFGEVALAQTFSEASEEQRRAIMKEMPRLKRIAQEADAHADESLGGGEDGQD